MRICKKKYGMCNHPAYKNSLIIFYYKIKYKTRASGGYLSRLKDREISMLYLLMCKKIERKEP